MPLTMFDTFPCQISEVDIKSKLEMMLAKMSIFLGEIISGDQGKLPHCPRVWSDLGRASSKSPALQSPPAARPCRWILPEEREGERTSRSQLPCDLPSEVSRGASALRGSLVPS